MASEMVSIAAPPTPWPARKAISQSMLGAKPQSMENSVKVTRPKMKTRFCPYLSAMRPIDRKQTASTRLYALSTHEACVTVVLRSTMIAGMAMLTMVTSSSAMNMPIETATRIHHLRGWPWSRVGSGDGSLTVLSFR